MTATTLDGMDPVLAGRLQRLAQSRGWSPEEALQRALERGLMALESEGRASLEAAEADVLSEAIAALEQIPNSTFAAIGKPPAAGEEQL